jgi:hypothetical protein
MGPEYVEWVRRRGRRVFHAWGNTFWDLELFELPVVESAGVEAAP